MSDDFKEYSKGEFLELVMPEKQLLTSRIALPYETNNWKWRNFLIYGDPAAQKTETTRLFAQWAAERYSSDDMSAYNISRSQVLNFLDCPMLNAKMIQMLLMDDLTGINKLSRLQSDNWFRFRHVVKRITQIQDGMILTFLGTHEYFSLPKVLRQGITGFIAKSIPSNPYDKNVINKWVGDAGMEILQRQSHDRLLFLPHEEVAVFRIMSFTGYVKTPFATVNYLRQWDWNGPAIKQKMVKA